MLQAQQLARSGKKLAAAPKLAPAIKVQKAEGNSMAEPAEKRAEISKGRPAGGSPDTPRAAVAAARDGTGPQASSEATVLLTDMAGDQDADSSAPAQRQLCASTARAIGKENEHAANARPTTLTPVKRALQANLPGDHALTPLGGNRYSLEVWC